MSNAFVIDAHAHFGYVGAFFAPECEAIHLLTAMDNAGISHAICMDLLTVWEGAGAGLEPLRDLSETSGRRVYFLGTFDPRRASTCLGALEQAKDWPGFVGLKLHTRSGGGRPRF